MSGLQLCILKKRVEIKYTEMLGGDNLDNLLKFVLNFPTAMCVITIRKSTYYKQRLGDSHGKRISSGSKWHKCISRIQRREYLQHALHSKQHEDISPKNTFLLCHLIFWAMKALIYQRGLGLRVGSYLLKGSFFFAWLCTPPKSVEEVAH